jgi:hypothetical protein
MKSNNKSYSIYETNFEFECKVIPITHFLTKNSSLKMNKQIRLTREQILQDNYLDEIDAGDSTDEEIDDVEINEETDEFDEELSDSNDDSIFMVPEPSVHLTKTPAAMAPSSIYRSITRSETADMTESEKEEIVYGRGPKSAPFEWSSKQNKNFVRQPEFQAHLLSKASSCESIIDFFLLIFDAKIVDKILICTNLRIQNPDDFVTNNEFLSFVGLLILFGLTNKSNIEVSEIWCPTSIHYMS